MSRSFSYWDKLLRPGRRLKLRDSAGREEAAERGLGEALPVEVSAISRIQFKGAGKGLLAELSDEDHLMYLLVEDLAAGPRLTLGFEVPDVPPGTRSDLAEAGCCWLFEPPKSKRIPVDAWDYAEEIHNLIDDETEILYSLQPVLSGDFVIEPGDGRKLQMRLVRWLTDEEVDCPLFMLFESAEAGKKDASFLVPLAAHELLDDEIGD